MEHGAHHGQTLCVGERALGAHDVDVALVELAEASLLRAVGAPHGLDLVALEGQGQARVHGHHTGQGHGEVVAEGEVGLAPLGALAALQDLVDELVALVAVLAHQGLDALEGRCLQRREAEACEDTPDRVDHREAVVHLGGQQIAGALGQVDLGHGSSGRPRNCGMMRVSRAWGGPALPPLLPSRAPRGPEALRWSWRFPLETGRDS